VHLGVVWFPAIDCQAKIWLAKGHLASVWFIKKDWLAIALPPSRHIFLPENFGVVFARHAGMWLPTPPKLAELPRYY
jgi:hypothetical protein